MPTITERVAANVRAEMARNGTTQADLAEALNLPQSSVSARVRGRVPFRLDEIELASAFFGVPLSELVPVEDATA